MSVLRAAWTLFCRALYIDWVTCIRCEESFYPMFGTPHFCPSCTARLRDCRKPIALG